MSPEKPKTPPERVERFDAVYEIIPGSEDFPDTETAFGGPHYTRNGLGRWASPSGSLPCLPLPSATSPKGKPRCGTTPLQFIRRFARKEPNSYCFDFSLVISSVGDLLPACGPR